MNIPFIDLRRAPISKQQLSVAAGNSLYQSYVTLPDGDDATNARVPKTILISSFAITCVM